MYIYNWNYTSSTTTHTTLPRISTHGDVANGTAIFQSASAACATVRKYGTDPFGFRAR